MEHVILFFSKGMQTGMPEAWPRDVASRSLFSGNHGSLSVGHYELCREDIGDLPGSPDHF